MFVLYEAKRVRIHYSKRSFSERIFQTRDDMQIKMSQTGSGFLVNETTRPVLGKYDIKQLISRW